LTAALGLNIQMLSTFFDQVIIKSIDFSTNIILQKGLEIHQIVSVQTSSFPAYIIVDL